MTLSMRDSRTLALSSIASVPRRPLFRPGRLPSLLVALLLPSMIGLGFWQLSRAAEKQELIAVHERRMLQAPVTVDALPGIEDPAQLRVRLQGRFDARHTWLLDSRVRDGQAGVEVLQPFHDDLSGRWLLLNRGWVAWPDRRVAPAFDTPETPLSLTASVYLPPGRGLQLQDEREPAAAWPRLIGQVEPARLWAELRRDGLAYEMRLEPGPASLRGGWAVVAMSPQKHTGYAVQWFAMAGALTLLFLYLGVHNAREIRHATCHRHA